MSRVDARVQVVDTQNGRTFSERSYATPIRIGRALDSDLVLPHPAIAARHGEIAIGARAAHFRSRAWLRASYVDGARVKRGRAVKVTSESIVSLGPYEVRVWFRVRDRRYERERKVTPLVPARSPIEIAIALGPRLITSNRDPARGSGHHDIAVPQDGQAGRAAGDGRGQHRSTAAK